MSDDDLSDLGIDLPPATPKRRGPGRPTREEQAIRDAERMAAPLPTMDNFLRPVNVTFLMTVFGKDRTYVRQRLAALPPVGYERANVPLYDFRQAAPLLIEPKVDIAQILENLSEDDIPIHLQDRFWGGQLKRQKWQVNAGRLWLTEDVLTVLGDVFMHLKGSLQLWVSTVNETEALTKKQRAVLTKLVDTLQEDLHARLVEMPKKKSTPSLAATEGDLIDRAQKRGPGRPRKDETPDAEDLL